MSKPYRYTRRVEFRDTDAAGIVHFSVYFNYMEEAEHAMLRDLGMNVLMKDDDGHYSFPRVAVSCDYQAPLRFSDVVAVDVTVVRMGESSVTYDFNFSCEGRPVADGKVTAVCCRLPENGKPTSMPIPADIVEKLSALLA